MANCFLLKLQPPKRDSICIYKTNDVLFDNTGSIENKSVTKIVGKFNFFEKIASYFIEKLEKFKVF